MYKLDCSLCATVWCSAYIVEHLDNSIANLTVQHTTAISITNIGAQTYRTAHPTLLGVYTPLVSFITYSLFYPSQLFSSQFYQPPPPRSSLTTSNSYVCSPGALQSSSCCLKLTIHCLYFLVPFFFFLFLFLKELSGVPFLFAYILLPIL